MKISLIQTSPQTDKADNLRITRGLMEDAAHGSSDPDRAARVFRILRWYSGRKTCAAESVSVALPTRWRRTCSRAQGSRPCRNLDGKGLQMKSASTIPPSSLTRAQARLRIIARSICSTSSGRMGRHIRNPQPSSRARMSSSMTSTFKVGCAICYDIRFAATLSGAGKGRVVMSSRFPPRIHAANRQATTVRAARARAPSKPRPILPPGADSAARFLNGERRHLWSLARLRSVGPRCGASDGVGFVTARIERAQIERASAHPHGQPSPYASSCKPAHRRRSAC